MRYIVQQVYHTDSGAVTNADVQDDQGRPTGVTMDDARGYDMDDLTVKRVILEAASPQEALGHALLGKGEAWNG